MYLEFPHFHTIQNIVRVQTYKQNTVFFLFEHFFRTRVGLAIRNSRVLARYLNHGPSIHMFLNKYAKSFEVSMFKPYVLDP